MVIRCWQLFYIVFLFLHHISLAWIGWYDIRRLVWKLQLLALDTLTTWAGPLHVQRVCNALRLKQIWRSNIRFACYMGFQFHICPSATGIEPLQALFFKDVFRKSIASETAWVGSCVFSNWVWLLIRLCDSVFTKRPIILICLCCMSQQTWDYAKCWKQPWSLPTCQRRSAEMKSMGGKVLHPRKSRFILFMLLVLGQIKWSEFAETFWKMFCTAIHIPIRCCRVDKHVLGKMWSEGLEVLLCFSMSFPIPWQLLEQFALFQRWIKLVWFSFVDFGISIKLVVSVVVVPISFTKSHFLPACILINFSSSHLAWWWTLSLPACWGLLQRCYPTGTGDKSEGQGAEEIGQGQVETEWGRGTPCVPKVWPIPGCQDFQDRFAFQEELPIRYLYGLVSLCRRMWQLGIFGRCIRSCWHEENSVYILDSIYSTLPTTRGSSKGSDRCWLFTGDVHTSPLSRRWGEGAEEKTTDGAVDTWDVR